MAVWLAQFPLRDLLNQEDVDGKEAHRLGKIVSERIEAELMFGRSRLGLAKKFASVRSQSGFNKALNELYDVADLNRIWVK